MERTDNLVIAADSQVLGVAQRFLGLFGQSIEIHFPPFARMRSISSRFPGVANNPVHGTLRMGNAHKAYQ